MARTDLVLTVRRPAGGARTHRFARGPVTLGRAASNAVCLDDVRVSSVHLRFVHKGDRWLVLDPGSALGAALNGGRLPANSPRPLRAGDALRIGDFVIDVALDSGDGLTTDSRDTDSVAAALLTNARQAGAWSLWVLDGGRAGHTATVRPGRSLLIGAGADCDLALPDPGIVARHASVELDRRGRLVLTVHGRGVSVRGQRVKRAILWPDDTIRVAGVSLRVRGPTGATGAESGGLSLFERFAILVILGSGGAMIWAWWGG